MASNAPLAPKHLIVASLPSLCVFYPSDSNDRYHLGFEDTAGRKTGSVFIHSAERKNGWSFVWSANRAENIKQKFVRVFSPDNS